MEFSPLSGRILQALHPRARIFPARIFHGQSFERFIAAHEEEVAGKLGLVVSNPPYGERGASAVEDPNPAYRSERNAYLYFLRCTADLLKPGGLGVYLVPYGFLTGTSRSLPRLREQVLRRHHLAAAYRLPSVLFPGANLVVELIFLRSRGG